MSSNYGSGSGSFNPTTPTTGYTSSFDSTAKPEDPPAKPEDPTAKPASPPAKPLFNPSTKSATQELVKVATSASVALGLTTLLTATHPGL
jgi:hypothetical protein